MDVLVDFVSIVLFVFYGFLWGLMSDELLDYFVVKERSVCFID